MKLAEADVFNMYCDVGTRFLPPRHFFFELVDHYTKSRFLRFNMSPLNLVRKCICSIGQI